MQNNIKGRNIFEIDQKNHFFIKKMVGSSKDIERRINNSLSFCKNNKFKLINSPNILIQKEDKSLVFELIENAKNCEDLNLSSINDIEKLYKKISKLLSDIHKMDKKESDKKIEIIDYNPFEYLTKEHYSLCTGGELQIYSIIQNDFDFKNAIENGAKDYEKKREVMIHGDIRLDQFLLDNDDNLWVVDFEEYSLGNRSKDLAGILGSLLFKTLLSTFVGDFEDLSTQEKINEAFLQKGSENLDKIRPIIKSFFEDYIKYAEIKELDYIEIAYFTSIFLLERIVSRAKLCFQLSAVDKAILGIARSMIIEKQNLVNFMKGELNE